MISPAAWVLTGQRADTPQLLLQGLQGRGEARVRQRECSGPGHEKALGKEDGVGGAAYQAIERRLDVLAHFGVFVYSIAPLNFDRCT